MAAPTTKRAKVEFPPDVEESLKEFHKSLQGVSEALEPLLKTNSSDIISKFGPLEQAQLDLASAYTLNSLFWMYLNCIGVDPKEHGVRQELERIKDYMLRVKAIEDKGKAAKLDKDAAKRFIRGSLWAPKDKTKSEGSTVTNATETSPSSAKKRKHR